MTVGELTFDINVRNNHFRKTVLTGGRLRWISCETMDVFISSYATSSNFVQESASLYLYDQEIIPRSDEWMSISALFEESAQLACEVNRFSLTCLDPKGDISTAIYDPNDSSSTLTLDSGSERCAPFVSFLQRLSSGYADYKYAETGDQSAE